MPHSSCKYALLSIGALCTSSAFSNQSVQVFGILDLTVQQSDVDGSGRRISIGNSGYAVSQIGFRGRESISEGTSVGFWLEGGLNPDVGTGRATNSNNQTSGAIAAQGLVFDRRAYADVKSDWGDVRIGRDFVPTQYINGDFDAFNTNGFGRIGNFTYMTGLTGTMPAVVAASNTLSYWLPEKLNGFYGMALVAFGENASSSSNKDDGNIQSFRFGFQRGALNVATAFNLTKYASTTTIGQLQHSNSGLTYDAGFAKIYGQYSRSTVKLTTGQLTKSVMGLGARIPTTNGFLRLSVAKLDDQSDAQLLNTNGSQRSGNDATQIALGYVHNMSKRTSLYGTYAKMSNQGSATYTLSGANTPSAGGKASGLELGIKHSF